MILIKGKRVMLAMTDGRYLRRPDSHGIIHDPQGEVLPRCDVFIGPFRRRALPVELDSHGRQYFGRRYQATEASVDVPAGPWKPVGQARGILYQRDRGTFANEKPYRHVFRRPVDVERCGSMIRLALPDGCVVNFRGFVSP